MVRRELHQDVDVAVRLKIISQHGAKKRQLVDVVLAAELGQPALRNLDYCTHGLAHISAAVPTRPITEKYWWGGPPCAPSITSANMKTVVAPASSRCSTGRRPVPFVPFFFFSFPSSSLGNEETAFLFECHTQL